MGKLEKRFPRYQKLLNLYPAAYKKRYGQEMLQTLADMLDDPDNSRSFVWLRAMLDLPLSITKQQLIYTGAAMQSQVPHYVKRNSLISAGLTLPFFVIVFSRLVQNNQLNSNEAWKSSLYITLLVLPLMAFLLCVYTFIKWSRSRQISVWKNLVDIRRSWLVVGVGCLAFLITIFVPFHDSTQCVIGNPFREVRNFSQTWQCIQDG